MSAELTPAQVDKERREFEAWAGLRGFIAIERHLLPDHPYRDYLLEASWQAYLARAELAHRAGGEAVAWRFNLDGQWFTGTTQQQCQQALKLAGMQAAIEPLYASPPPSAVEPPAASPDVVMVPVEPTEAMIEAGMDTGEFENGVFHVDDRAAANVYKAMLSAATPAEGEGK